MKNLIFIFLALIIISCSREINPPVTKKIPYEERHFGVMLKDSYHWLKDKTRKNKEVINHIKAENKYAQAILHHTEKLQKKIYNEIVSRMVESDISLPIKIDNYLYYKKTIKELQYPKYYRKSDEPNAKEECYLDENELAKGKKFFDISEMKISPNHNLLAIAVDTTGAENYKLLIKNLKDNTFLPDTANYISDIVWLDNKTILYTITDKSNRSYRLYKHILGNKINKDKLIYQEDDPLYYIWIYKTKSKRFIILTIESKTTSEIRFMDVKHPEKGFQLIEPRQEGIDYQIQDHGNKFFVITNDNGAINYKIMITDINNPQKKFWKTYIPENDSISISMDVFDKFMVIKQRKDGLTKFLIKPFNNKKEFYIDFPEKTYSAYMETNPNYFTNKFRYGYESFITPYSIYEIDITTGKQKLLKQRQINGGYTKSEYKTERLFATANDGTKIPISIYYKTDLFKQDGSMPILLDGYGAYGDANDPYFSSYRLSLINRGFAYAIAHVRGGGEYGKKWYNAGKMLNKKNTFTDFITCSEYLINKNYTSKEHLYIYGASAGGLLVGAVLNMQSDLYAGVIADVPFVDVLNTMFDPTLTSTTSEYKEWGNPNIKVYFDYIRSYCPYQNVHHREYPPMLVRAGFYDTRVNYWEPAKWVAKLREYKTDKNKIIFITAMNEGHQGASGKFDFVKEVATNYAFLLDLEKNR